MKQLLTACAVLGVQISAFAKTLTIGYSDWPGWVAWEVGIKKGWFEEVNVDVKFQWSDYVKSMEAFAAGKLDAVCMTNGDALVMGAGSLGEGVPAKNSTCILLNDFSYGNDMVIAGPGITKFADLKGQRVGLEEGFVPHLLFFAGMEEEGISPESVTIVNTPTDKTPVSLREGLVKAVSAWQPSSGIALKSVEGASEIFSSADVPGIIFNGLYVDRADLRANRFEWQKVVKVWYRIVAFIKDEKNKGELLKILSQRAGRTPSEYAEFLEGTYILSLEEAHRCWHKRSSIGSIFGSSHYVDRFNTKYGVYGQSQDIDSYYDAAFLPKFIKKNK